MHSYFRGWYFKHQNDHECIAFIPAFHIDRRGNRTASIQVITDKSAHNINLPYADFIYDAKDLCITAGTNVFSHKGITIHLDSEGIEVNGTLEYGALSPIRYDIMGPFRYIPFMECRHSVFSMMHSVNGTLTLNGKIIEFMNATGYIEGDRGGSFPTRYAWTQCSFQNEPLRSLMLSVADIPFLGRSFTGVIGVLIWKQHEYRIATYLGAKVECIDHGYIRVRQGNYTFEATLLDKRSMHLNAPVQGEMTRLIRENPLCHAHYRFTIGSSIEFDVDTARASFEYEYDTLSGNDHQDI